MMFPQYNDETIEFMIWEHTSYPFNDVQQCKEQLKQLKESLDNSTNS